MKYPDTHHDTYGKTVFGFWIYLLTDFMMFGTFFATYLVLKTGSSGQGLFDLPYTLTQTVVLLMSSATTGLAGVYMHLRNRGWTLMMWGLTFVLGAVFMGMESVECYRWVISGNTWSTNGFLSILFTIVGTYGLHLLLGMVWIVVLLVPVWRRGIEQDTIRRLSCLRMFWQFLNIVWLFIVTIVYLGVTYHA